MISEDINSSTVNVDETALTQHPQFHICRQDQERKCFFGFFKNLFSRRLFLFPFLPHLSPMESTSTPDEPVEWLHEAGKTPSSPSNSPTASAASAIPRSSSQILHASSKNRKLLLNLVGDIKLKLSELKALEGELPLTQFIIVGGQSSGKSRLVESLAGARFNFVSGTLGSRRPTVVEFRCVKKQLEPRWFHRPRKSANPFAESGQSEGDWEEVAVTELQRRVSEAHEELGKTVSSDPIYIRVESAHCVDMQVVDLPGFRDFSDHPEKQL